MLEVMFTLPWFLRDPEGTRRQQIRLISRADWPLHRDSGYKLNENLSVVFDKGGNHVVFHH